MRVTVFGKLILMGVIAMWAAGADGTDEEKKPDINTIVNKANLMAYYQGDDGKAHVTMTITTWEEMDETGKILSGKKKSERTREFNVLRQDGADGGDQKYYVYFEKPADVRRMVFMVHKHADIKKDDDRWLYLPALDLVKRIAAGDKRTSFVGSDFLYEDVSGRSLEEDTHELMETTDTFYVIKNTPKAPKTVEFGWFTVWIDRKTFLPMKMEYFDKAGHFFRRIESKKVETIQELPTVVLSLVTDVTKKSTTVMVFSDVKYNLKLGDIFTERYLRRPPREAIR